MMWRSCGDRMDMHRKRNGNWADGPDIAQLVIHPANRASASADMARLVPISPLSTPCRSWADFLGLPGAGPDWTSATGDDDLGQAPPWRGWPARLASTQPRHLPTLAELRPNWCRSRLRLPAPGLSPVSANRRDWPGDRYAAVAVARAVASDSAAAYGAPVSAIRSLFALSIYLRRCARARPPRFYFHCPPVRAQSILGAGRRLCVYAGGSWH
jgi:hypothetical protein